MRLLKHATLLLCLLGFSGSAYAYIDPGTAQTVISGLGAALGALLAAVAFAWVSVKFYFKSIASKCRVFFGSLSKRSVAVAVLTVALVSGIGASFLMSENVQVTSDDKGRVVVVGFDGMDPKVTRELIEQGKLPNLKRLSESGDFKDMQTSTPPQSPVVWSSIATGANSSLHGITDFISRQGNTYTPDLALLKHNPDNFLKQTKKMFLPPVDSKYFFWELLQERGVSSSTIRWPMTFPASGDSKVISGLGTPDVLGGLGKYTVFTSNPDMFDEEIKGEVKTIKFTNNLAKTEVIGPKSSSIFGKETHSKAGLTIQKLKESDSVVLSAGEMKLTLSKGEWSPWVPLEFSIGMGRTVGGMVMFLPVEVFPDVHVYMTSVQIDPSNPIYKIATPEALALTLSEKVGRFHTLGMAEDTNALGDYVLDEKQFVEMCDTIWDESEKVFWQEYGSGDKFFAYVFDTTDRVQHMFWRFKDKKHPLYNEDDSAKFLSSIEHFYIRADKHVGKVMETLNLETDTLLVISDHGFTNYRRSFHVNSWLIENGYMALKEGEESFEALFKSVDWSKTKAFALGFSQIFLNLKGRDKSGVVAMSEVEGLKSEIASKLSEVVDTELGEKAVVEVYDTSKLYGSELKNGPELIVGMNKGYRFSWQTAIGGAPEYLFEDNAKPWSGDHCVDAKFVPGVLFSNKKFAVDDPTVLDIAPTVLKSFDIEPAEHMQGRDLFKSENKQFTIGFGSK